MLPVCGFRRSQREDRSGVRSGAGEAGQRRRLPGTLFLKQSGIPALVFAPVIHIVLLVVVFLLLWLRFIRFGIIRLILVEIFFILPGWSCGRRCRGISDDLEEFSELRPLPAALLFHHSLTAELSGVHQIQEFLLIVGTLAFTVRQQDKIDRLHGSQIRLGRFLRIRHGRQQVLAHEEKLHIQPGQLLLRHAQHQREEGRHAV